MPNTATKTPFYRPAQRVGCPKIASGSLEKALQQILKLVDLGQPKTLPEANRRLSAIRLVAAEGLGNESLYEMVCRISEAHGV